jgi:hypothetical protein
VDCFCVKNGVIGSLSGWSLALAKRLGFWAITALVCSSRLIEREGGLVTAAFEDWVSFWSWWYLAGALSVEATLKNHLNDLPEKLQITLTE